MSKNKNRDNIPNKPENTKRKGTPARNQPQSASKSAKGQAEKPSFKSIDQTPKASPPGPTTPKPVSQSPAQKAPNQSRPKKPAPKPAQLPANKPGAVRKGPQKW